jgi:hypothetical protein
MFTPLMNAKLNVLLVNENASSDDKRKVREIIVHMNTLGDRKYRKHCKRIYHKSLAM